MATEIERKFLVDYAKWEDFKKSANFQSIEHLNQGYLSSNPEKTIRVRTSNSRAFLTIKGKTEGISRQEFEYEIPSSDAEILLSDFTESALRKTRYTVLYKGKKWEIDEFHDANRGLILAEIELENIDETYNPPDWLGIEVSEDLRYYNSNLAHHPFRIWGAVDSSSFKKEN